MTDVHSVNERRAIALLSACLLALVLLLAAPGSAGARTHVYKLPGGGKLTVPSTSLSPRAKIVVRGGRTPRSRSRSGLRSVGKPVSLRVRRGQVTGPVRLTLPYRKRIDAVGMPLDLTVEIAYLDVNTRQWRTIPATVNPSRKTVTATIEPAVWNEANLVIDGKGARAAASGGSSWWNPFSWDWGNIALRLSQRAGELRGARTGPAPCTSGGKIPDWVAQVITNNGAELQLRTCAEGEGDRVVVQIVNNRPYGVILKYGAPVAWGWHEDPGTVSGSVAMMLADELVSPNELYIAPLKRASVGIPRGDWFHATFQASITPKSLAADAMRMVADQVDLRGVRPQVFGKLASSCSEFLKPRLDGSAEIETNVLGNLNDVAGCLLEAAPKLAAEGLLDRGKVGDIEHVLAVLKHVGKVAQFAQFAGIAADLYTGVSPSMRGNMMFAVRRRADDPASPPPGGGTPPGGGGSPATPAPPPPPPPPPATWAEQQGSLGANTFTNPYNASGMGAKIQPYQWVQVTCKVHAPQIVSANPDGYWYRIASAPWNNAYYAVANTFWNGDIPGQKPYTHNTDWAVPNC